MNAILIVLEPQGTTLKRTSLEAITAARGIAGGAPMHGVIINGTSEQINAAGAYGLANVVNVSMPSFANGTAAAAIATAANTVGADVVLFGANATGKDIAPRVAVRLGAGLLADCVGLNNTTRLQSGMSTPSLNTSTLNKNSSRSEAPTGASNR